MGKPIIRFKGYEDDWEQHKLGDICIEMLAGGDIDKEKIVEQGKYPVIANALTKEGIVGFYEHEYRVKAPAVTITGRGDVGHAKARKIDFTPVVRLLAIRTNHDVDFIENAINNLKVMVESTGVPQLTVPQLEKYKLFIPSTIAEERIIGAYFCQLDHLITLHQRKCDETKKLKKYMLQNMFPQDGEKIPRIRFDGFTDDWEQRKLGTVVEDYVEKTTVENQYPVLTSSQQMGIVLQDNYFSGDRVSQSGNIGYFVIPRGYFAYRSRSDNDVFVFNRNDCIDKGIISYFYPVFKPNGSDSDFLLRRLNFGLEKQLKIASEGTGQHVLSLKKFKNMTALFPEIEEQKKIGEYFAKLDTFITLHQRKCDELQKIKKFMLQNMFV